MNTRVLWELSYLAWARIAPAILNCDGDAGIEDLVIKGSPDIARDIELLRSYQSLMHENSVKWRGLFDEAKRLQDSLAST